MNARSLPRPDVPTSMRPPVRARFGPGTSPISVEAVRGSFYYLYMIEDVWSRKIVGWQIHEEESMELAASLFRETCAYLELDPDGLVLHSDNGGPMKGFHHVGHTSETRCGLPHSAGPTSATTIPYSEALFRTLKYRPEYPSEAFSSLEHARAWVASFVTWYNTAHRHSAIRFVTPDERHDGRDKDILAKRHRMYQLARDNNPERWSGQTRNWEPVETVTLNPNANKTRIIAIRIRQHESFSRQLS